MPQPAASRSFVQPRKERVHLRHAFRHTGSGTCAIRSDPYRFLDGEFREDQPAFGHQANPSNVDTVLVAGKAIKRNGVLVSIDWPSLRAQLMKSHEHVMSCAQRIPLEKIQNLWTSTWYYDIASMILPEKAKQRQMRSLA